MIIKRKLIFDNPNANYLVKEVKAWRQVNQIDLLLEVYLLDNNIIGLFLYGSYKV